MKITFGRKFLGCCIATVLLCAMFALTLVVAPNAITAGVVIAFGGFIMFLWTGFIGGNMFAKFVKSKYFHGELVK